MNHTLARRKMVENQLRANRVTEERLVAALESLPRERFVAPERAGIAYVDEDLPVAPGRYLMEPMVLGRLVQALEVKPHEMVLDLACATGYSSALLARLAGTVVAVEPDAALAQQANDTLNALAVDNAVVIAGPLAEGYAKQAPYDAILLNGAVAAVPDTLFAQLAEDGRLAAVVKEGEGLGQASLFIRQAGGVVARRILFDAGTPLLPGFAKAPGFVF